MSDAGRWRRIYSQEWHATGFQGLSDAERVVYFYCRTGPQSTSIGAYRVSAALAAEDLANLTAFDFDVRLSAVCEACSWRFDAASRVLWMPNWLQENPPQSPNVLVSWRKLLRNLPDCDLKFEIAEAINRLVKDLPEAWRKEWGKEPLKDLRISVSQTKAKAPSHQGNQGAGDSGNQGFRGAGSSAKNGNAPTRLFSVARQALELVGRTAPFEAQIDALQNMDGNCTRSEASAALNRVLAEGRAS